MSKKPAISIYKTPLKKLAIYFESSRNKWRARSTEKQKRIDFLETKARDLEISRNKWKTCAKELEQKYKKKLDNKNQVIEK